jgi:hypothetical protein
LAAIAVDDFYFAPAPKRNAAAFQESYVSSDGTLPACERAAMLAITGRRPRV